MRKWKNIVYIHIVYVDMDMQPKEAEQRDEEI